MKELLLLENRLLSENFCNFVSWQKEPNAQNEKIDIHIDGCFCIGRGFLLEVDVAI